MEREYKMSAARAQELQEELNYLKTTRSDEVAEQIKVARGFGDLSENSEYDEAKNEQGKLYSRIAELEEILQHVVIVDESNAPTNVVTIGCKVTVADKNGNTMPAYRIVGSQESDPMNGFISEESPFGKDLVGAKEGDTVTVEAPSGAIVYTVQKIERYRRADMSEQKTTQQPEQELSEQRRVRREKLAALQAAGEDPFQQTRFDWDAPSAQIKEPFDQMEGRAVKVAGRLMSKRGMGKVSFCDLQDRDGRIQLYARQDEMDEAVYKKFKKFDIGDIVGVEGEVFRTQRGEMSVRAKNITLLSKALLPLPEKFHGLTDLELRYRQRYVDLIVNPEVKRNFVIRSKFIKHVRDFLDERGYMEVETPVLNTISGGATARPFITHHNTLDIDMYMRIATELPLKRLIVGGLDRVYEIGRIFRNEGMDPKHNPEFTTVELYQAYTDFNGMMDLFEDLLSSAAQKILGTYQVE